MNINALAAFYLSAAIMVLAVAIVAFPTLWENAKRRSSKKKVASK